ncbi:MAG: hypothetical protein P4L16_06020 [Chlamydiales bacterium]|nr:hypothetical protein [Chlamydiales bacterium]
MAAGTVEMQNCFIPHTLGKVSIFHENKSFSVEKDGRRYAIQQYDLSPELRNIEDKALEKILNHGQLCLKKIGNDYGLEFRGELVGGGPFFGALAMCLTVVVGGACAIIPGLQPLAIPVISTGTGIACAALAAPTP